MRSLVGDRDSEIGVVVHSSELASRLRNKLWAEHLGPGVSLTKEFFVDFPAWRGTAKRNSKAYAALLEHSCPMGGPRNAEEFTNGTETFEAAFRGRSLAVNQRVYDVFAASVKGHLVKFPRHFLEECVEETDTYAVSPGGAVPFILSKGLFSAINIVLNPVSTFAFTMIDEQFQ